MHVKLAKTQEVLELRIIELTCGMSPDHSKYNIYIDAHGDEYAQGRWMS